MRLYLFSFGKLKTPGLRDAADYYQSILKPWVPLQEIELKPIAVPDKSPATRLKVQEKEEALLTDRISNVLSPRGVIYLLDETGKARTTQAWAEQVRNWENDGIPEIALCIGSSLGFSSALKTRAKASFSLGPQTFSHELARVVLLEQLYRAWSVVRGHPYHNEG